MLRNTHTHVSARRSQTVCFCLNFDNKLESV